MDLPIRLMIMVRGLNSFKVLIASEFAIRSLHKKEHNIYSVVTRQKTSEMNYIYINDKWVSSLFDIRTEVQIAGMIITFL